MNHDSVDVGLAVPVAPVVPARGAVRPLGLRDVRLPSGFWADRQELGRTAIIPHIARWLERSGWLANFDATAAGTVALSRQGREFSDSEVYKMLEAAAWELERSDDAEIRAIYDRTVERVAAAQQPDGYLNTNFGSDGQNARYTDLAWGHELYCFGHLFQAAVARLRTGRDDTLVDVAIRAADHVVREFGGDDDPRVCGHAEVEVALAELGRATGDTRYVEMARKFIDRRGRASLPDIEFGRAYFQDDMPIRDATVLRGHTVRALYLSSGALDVAADTDDVALERAVADQYARTLERRTYLTGGMGSHHQDEAFGDDWELPSERGYCETCAGVGSVMTAWRLLLATGDLAYGDIIERTLYNVVATSPRADGRAFFYTNPLQQRVAGEPADEAVASARAQAQLRAPWFEVSCCPPNVARTFAQLAAYVAVADDTGVSIVHFTDADITLPAADGTVALALSMRTAYPADGTIAIEVHEAVPGSSVTLRVPSWAAHATLVRGDERIAVDHSSVRVGDVIAGERFTLELSIAPRITIADDRIDAVRGCVAVEAGPLVLCLESVDLPDGANMEDVRVGADARVTATPTGAVITGALVASPASPWPYGAPEDHDAHSLDLDLVPYHSWANRGPATMRVWLPTR
ncbi:glycoside hydrolase family 127 protein [Microbacterium gorillae]|uniref:glycoside hydrolase family 127 protein n=1 Tax=Microbacterium gorillae TaxID=1231063 RepID=UPI00058C9E34|nr:beta-L-arabinofuranosidase domain-containing protein [Microbacterium gorillae]